MHFNFSNKVDLSQERSVVILRKRLRWNFKVFSVSRGLHPIMRVKNGQNIFFNKLNRRCKKWEEPSRSFSSRWLNPNAFLLLPFANNIEHHSFHTRRFGTQYCDIAIKRYCDKKIILRHRFLLTNQGKLWKKHTLIFFRAYLGL